jgi:CBS-domain-containing membrane protein
MENKEKVSEKTPWSESAIELSRPSERCFTTKLVAIFTDGECHVVSVTDPNGHILGFLDRSRYFFFQVVPQLHSRG